MFIFLAICNSMLLLLVVIKHCSPTAVLVTRNRKPGTNELEIRIVEDEMVVKNLPDGLSANYMQYWEDKAYRGKLTNIEYTDRMILLAESRHLMPPERPKIVIAGRRNRQTAAGISGNTQLTYDFADKVARAEGKDRILRQRRGESTAHYNRRKQLLIQKRSEMRRRFGPAGNHVIARFARNNRERRLLARQRHLERDLRNNAFGKFKRQYSRYRGIYNNVGPTLHALDDSYFEFVRKFRQPETNFLAVRKNEIYEFLVGRRQKRGDHFHRLKPKAQKLRGHLYTEAMDYKLSDTLEGIYGPANIGEGFSPIEPPERTPREAKNDLIEAMAAIAKESANHRHFMVSEDFRGYHFSADGKTTKLQHKPSQRHPLYSKYMNKMVKPKEAVKNMIEQKLWKFKDVPKKFKRTEMQKRLENNVLHELYLDMRRKHRKGTKAGKIITKYDKYREAKRRRNLSAAGRLANAGPLLLNRRAENRRQQRRQLRIMRPQIPPGSARRYS